jgi:hypothetical protein
MIEVSFQSIRHVYPIANSYYFKLAQADVKCVCDCPGKMLQAVAIRRIFHPVNSFVVGRNLRVILLSKI